MWGGWVCIHGACVHRHDRGHRRVCLCDEDEREMIEQGGVWGDGGETGGREATILKSRAAEALVGVSSCLCIPFQV